VCFENKMRKLYSLKELVRIINFLMAFYYQEKKH